MNPEIKAEWVRRLRSGEYQQGRQFLSQVLDGNKKHCCLGVLCEMAVEQGVIGRVIDDAPGAESVDRFGGSIHLPPQAVTDWAEVSDRGAGDEWTWFVGAPEVESLYALNDNGVPFRQIARVIEEMF